MRPILTSFIVPAVGACLAIAAFAPAATAGNLRADETKQPIVATFVGLDGVLTAGKPIQISWTLKGAPVKDLEINPWAECELFFSPDGGNTWTRITPHLSVTTRSHGWTVPDVSTGKALIALQVGIEGDGEFYFFESSFFTIRRAAQR